MLAELHVRNFALIEKLSLEFGPGFNVMSGETGAGKSIIVGAINLILGGRASGEMIRRGADEAEVMALFTLDDPAGFSARLEELGLPVEEEVVVRRVLNRSGRNRVYINGSPAALNQLSALGRELVAVSGQHEHQQLLDPDRQLLYLDQYGGLMERRELMRAAHEKCESLRTEKKSLEKKIAEAREKADLFEFQADEISKAELNPGEDEELEKERTLARNAEKIFTLVRNGYDLLYGQSGAVIEVLDQVRTDLERASVLDERLGPVLEQVGEAFHQLDDAASFLRSHLEELFFDPERLEQVDDRLALINRLKRKYGPNLEEIIEYGRQAAGRLDDLSGMTENLAVIEGKLNEAENEAQALAEDLTRLRREKASQMSTALTEQLRSLGMPRLEFDIGFNSPPPESRPGPLGRDEIEFLIAPNLGEELKPLARIASGGELSRTTLALKTLLAGVDKIQTVIFDEVDAGIGGAVAEVVGWKLKDLAGFHQVLCITHLPQIAVFGDYCHRVFKQVRGERTLTEIKPLSPEEKVEEISRMIGGLNPGEKARDAALELMARAARENPDQAGKG